MQRGSRFLLTLCNSRPGVQSVLLILAIAGCGDDGRVSDDETGGLPSGIRLVAGSSLDEIGLLVIPRDGGVAHLRDLISPAESVWAGSARLPATIEAHSLGSTVVLRAADGTVRRYDPARDRVSVLGRTSPEALWSGDGRAGVFADPEGGALLAISDDGTWSYEPGEAIGWALPAASGVVLAIAGSGETGRLLLFSPEGAEPRAADLELGSPALVTAWGSRLVAPESGEGRLRFVSVPSLEVVQDVPLDGPPMALAASPSSHRVYVATGDEPSLVGIDRFSGATRRIARFESPLTDLRLSVLGEYLLVYDGEHAWRVAPTDGESVGFASSWRSDLPIGLPDGWILAESEGAVWRVDPAGAGERQRLGTADAWWLPVRWRPAPPTPDRLAGASVSDMAAAASDTGVADGSAAPGDPAADPGTEEPEPLVPPGHYAIVASSQQQPGVADLARALARADYPTRIQRHRDEANEVWYRALVGPYPTREQAEGIARRLRRERGLQVWISEVGPDPRASVELR